MKDYVIMTDAAADLPGELTDSAGIEIIPMDIIVNGIEKGAAPEGIDTFYKDLKGGIMPQTSQISIDAYKDAFLKQLNDGKDIIYAALSSGLSGSYGNAVKAAEEVLVSFPERRIEIIDTRSASIGEGAAVYMAAHKAEDSSFDEMVNSIKDSVSETAHIFFTDDLFHLKRGGRIGASEPSSPPAMKIKPIISFDEDGGLKVISKVRGIGNAIDYLAGFIKENAAPGGTLIIGHAAAPDRAEKLKEAIYEQCPGLNIIITEIGPVIGTHTGAGMTAAAFIKGI